MAGSMSRKIEEAFNDCFERLLSGESLQSCLSRYPEFAAELDSMLRTSFDIKRRVYPVQPRPEFKYWGRVRLQNVQESITRQPASRKSGFFNLRRNLAITMAALLVFVIASTGTAAASSDALPDQPLYNVKLAVEQVQLTLTPSETDKAELYASLAEKRAQEIAVMASQGKTDKVISTTARLYYQLDQAEQLFIKSETAAAGSSTGWIITPSASEITAPAAGTGNTTGSTTSTLPAPATTTSPIISAPNQAVPTLTVPSEQRKTGTQADNTSKPLATQRAVNEINKARIAINASSAKSLTILQNALDKAPASAKPNLSQIIERTKITNERINAHHLPDSNLKPVPPGSKLNNDDSDDDSNTEHNRHSPLIVPNKKNIVPPSSNNPSGKSNQGGDPGQLDTSQGTDDGDHTGNTTISRITVNTTTTTAQKVTPKLPPIAGDISNKSGITK